MAETKNTNNPNCFEQFNTTRVALAQQFQELIGIVGNNVFHGQISSSNPNVLEEIGRQSSLLEPEKNVLRHIHFFASNLIHSRFLLGVLGRFKAGKSTLLNALAGQDISPMDTRISTGVLNFTYWNDKEECIVVYDSGHEMPILPSEKIFYVDFRHNPDNEKGIHSVRHGSPNLALQKEIMFVDTPGLEAVNRIHEKITLDFVAQCHAAIVVSTYPPFGETELRFYERIKAVIPNIFLIQNLPADKLVAWVELEAQTLENLHKLGFYTLDAQTYGKTDVRTVLHKIADDKDAKELAKFKQIHNIHLYSMNGKDAYEAVVNSTLDPNSRQKRLEDSKFLAFKNDLYDFLSRQQGGKLIEDYLLKGKLILAELIQLVEGRRDLLRKSLDEIEKQIQEHDYQKQKTTNMLEMMVDRTTLKMMEMHKNLKSQIMEKDINELVLELNKAYGELNIFRLRKNQIKEIKLKIIEFNRLFGQRFQDCTKDLQVCVAQAHEDISKAMESHGIFSKMEIKASFAPVQMGEISGAGYIDYGFAIVFHGGMAYIGGSILTAILGTGSGIALIGGLIGLGLSIPLSKYCAPVLEFGKDLISKIARRPTNTVFEDYRSKVRERLDEIERLVLDQMVIQFKTEVTKNAKEYFDVFTKRLMELKEKKAHGMTQADCEEECKKLDSIVSQLKTIEKQFTQSDGKEGTESESDAGVQSLFKGIKGYLKKMKQK